MEIITGVDRRRRWRVEEKFRIVAETEQPGACFVEVARRHEVMPKFSVELAAAGSARHAPGRTSPVFLPVRLTNDFAVSRDPSADSASAPAPSVPPPAMTLRSKSRWRMAPRFAPAPMSAWRLCAG